MAKKLNPTQTVLDFTSSKWPNQELFPINQKGGVRTVQNIIYPDIANSTHYIIVTGFTSLSNLVDLFGSKNFPELIKTRILIGFEPNIRGRKEYKLLGLEKEIKDYWLKKGLSIMQGGAVINLIDKINQGSIEFRFRNKLHAKIYVGDDYAILGSSNFSYNGLNSQEEANIRVKKNLDINEENQYQSIQQIAESYYEDAADYNKKIIALLSDLIKEATWQEALARAIAEIVEGDWLNSYREIITKLEQSKLWPTQWKGLAQGVSILQNQSNVLIADPTGAGKTKLCTALILSLQHWLYEIGKNYNTESLIICPPLVMEKWRNEFKAFKRIGHSQGSMGLLSSPGKKQKSLIDDLQITNILTIDEAHNYLAPNSNRTNLIKDNNADYKVLITATPISKKVEDLLRLIELLDIDNLSDEDFEIYKELISKPYIRNHKNEDIDMLRKFISKFTVRRTKKSLNREIEKDQASYLNRLGKVCKFPTQHELTYVTEELDSDIALVEQINLLLAKLKGLTYFISFNAPGFEINGDENLQTYIQRRISAGKALSIYMIRAALRSSHVALVEHIEGSLAAMQYFKFTGKNKVSGNKLEKLEALIRNQRLPRKSKIFRNQFFPDWLTDKQMYIKSCEVELQIYKDISALAKKMSGSRELGKAKALISAFKKHENILAFDSTVITLYYLRELFTSKYPNQAILVASGSEKDSDNEKVLEALKLDSEDKKRYLVLCSDKMSESVDLQKASCVFLLDMPSVLRIVEQRIGRVDRMDSMHSDIDIYWPEDSEAYSLKTDGRLIETNEMVDQIYGSNFAVPEALRSRFFMQTDSAQDMINEYKEFIDKDESWGGIHDSFQCIVEMKEGENPLIDEVLYNQFTNVSSEVKTRVSFVLGNYDWCFMALRGDKSKSPRWYFIDGKNNIHTDYTDVCTQLRKNLIGDCQSLKWNDRILKRYVTLFKNKEIELLPVKKRRALKVAEYILTKKIANKQVQSDVKPVYNEMVKIVQARSSKVIDFERLGEEWILILKPYLKNRREKYKRKKAVMNFSSLKVEHKTILLPKELMQKIIDNCIMAETIDKRIAACIIGVGNNNNREVIVEEIL